MTVLMTLVGGVVFIISLFTKTFKVALKRLMMCALAGLIIDLGITILAAVVLVVIV